MLTTHNYSFLKDKKVLLLSDTGNPYKYLINFIYYVCIFFGKNNTQETAALKRLTRDMLLLYNNIIVITESGVDYDEDYTV